MRTPKEIYEAYQIMPNLQLHQLRVAAVGKFLCDNFTESVNKNDVLLACLFHDMGNIVKFDLSRFPEALEPHGLAYWEGVQQEYFEKYGRDQHAANVAIAKELGLPQQIIEMYERSGYSKIRDIVERGTIELKIVQYADLRVAPHGVVSLAERFADFAQRYAQGKTDAAALEAGKGLEQQIFARSLIQPEDITNEIIEPLTTKLYKNPIA